MYLKSIEVNGFKSFAHKMVFKFEHGITGIVGPNGSGKSNVADAVRWVLGEQSAKQLRGSKMEDVIFSGTELRKPMGSAYVAITMDNGDGSLPIPFEEVTVARRVYRSGESEYLMNGSPCRRKDIVELFFDTGVGKEGYSIIGQGQIDQILSGKPEERRELFDEAAGIVKYKKNKIETQKSLDAERENLIRVNDILSELERQIGPLEKQSEKARKYLLLRDKLKEKDSLLFLMENRRLSDELKSLETKIEIAENDLKDANERIEKAKKRYEQEDAELNQLKDEISRLTEEISDEKVQKQRREGEIKVLEEQIHTEKIREDHFRSNQERLTGEIDEKRRELNQLQEETAEIRRRFEEAQAERIEKESKLAFYQKEMQDLSEELAALEQRMQSFSDRQMEMAGKLERFQTVEEQLQVRIQSLEEQKKQLEKEAGQNEAERIKIQDEIKKFSEQKIELEKQLKKQKEIQAQAENRREDAVHAISVQKEKYHRAQSNYETLRNMAERYDGYGFGIKKIMEQKSRIPGIIGVVSDIIKVEQKYEAAIETALGGSIQNIVTDTQQTAKDLIGFLRRNRFGRVTFLPLNAVKGRSFSWPEALKEKGVVGIASQLAFYDERYRDLFASLLGQVLVVETMDAGIAIANKYHHSLRIVTMEGDSLNRGGSMSGGAFKNKGNLLGRNREVKELENRLNRLAAELKKAEDAKEGYDSEIDSIRKECAKIQQKIQEISMEQHAGEISLSAAAAKKQDYEKQKQNLTEQIETLRHEKNMAKDDASDLLTQKSDLEISSQEDEENIRKISRKLEETKETAENQARSIGEMHLKTNQLKQQMEFAQSNYDRVGFELEKLEADQEKNQKEFQSVKETAGNFWKKIEHLKNEIAEEIREIRKKEETLICQKEQEKLKSESYRDILREREELVERAGAMDKERYRLTSAREKQKEKQKELLDYMWDTYEVTYHQLKETMTEEPKESLSRIKEDIVAVKGEIRALGPVNVNAVEEYKEVAERYEFLLAQKEDVVKAEKHLNGLMKELEESMRKQFDEKFKDIQRMFQRVFVELFGGGTAKLELTDEDILESGIRITAQPPGKKLQNMMQLSGGEKALTAIALLFAIQNLKPSPFCLLDEIEAALDDLNVKRFAQYLHKLSRETQFIVITHRRGTMMAADVLYGITMQEKGVSTQVSVNLIENDLDE